MSRHGEVSSSVLALQGCRDPAEHAAVHPHAHCLLPPASACTAPAPHLLPRPHAAACTLDLQLVGEEFDTRAEAGLYPFNAIRNRALMLAQTEASRGAVRV